jgi:hypothetical protein
MRRNSVQVLAIIWLACATLGRGFAQGAREAVVDPGSVNRATAQLTRYLSDRVRGAGGDLGKQSVYLVIGLSTGHFSADPARAEAARQLAGALAKNMLAPGDVFRTYAYEMDVWRQTGPFAIDRQEDRASLIQRLGQHDFWPLTPMAGSQGGHDTERVLERVANDLHGLSPPCSNYVIVLLSNYAASVAPTGTMVAGLGENSQEYQTALQQIGAVRQPGTAASGASLVMQFDVTQPDGTRVQRDVQAVVVLPQQFQGRGIPGGRWPSPLAGVVGWFGKGWHCLWIVLVVVATLLALALRPQKVFISPTRHNQGRMELRILRWPRSLSLGGVYPANYLHRYLPPRPVARVATRFLGVPTLIVQDSAAEILPAPGERLAPPAAVLRAPRHLL